MEYLILIGLILIGAICRLLLSLLDFDNIVMESKIQESQQRVNDIACQVHNFEAKVRGEQTVSPEEFDSTIISFPTITKEDILKPLRGTYQEEYDRIWSPTLTGIAVRPTETNDRYLINDRYLSDYVKPKVEYICNYCGTRYVSDENGFIPNCHNCGARLDKENKE